MIANTVALLTRVVAFADVVLRGGPIADRVDEFRALQVSVDHVCRTPIDDDVPRLVDEHTVLLIEILTRLERARRIDHGPNVLLWSQLAGVILPRVREDLGAALERQARAR